MFEHDKFIYIHMQKTAGTHITALLEKFFEGEQFGKHKAPKAEKLNSGKSFIASIRNPWDWYLSLWTFGVQGNGTLMRRLTKRNLYRYFRRAIKNPKKNYCKLANELSKDVNLWRGVYDSSDNVNSFRKWLKLIHDPANRYCMDEGYGDTAITDICGLMTYRYLRLCCLNPIQLEDQDAFLSYDDIVEFEKRNCYIDFFIRQESVEDDFCKALEKIRPLTQEEKGLVYSAKKTNTSKRSLMITDYYDRESIDLIQRRDSLLIEKFGYFPPEISG